MNLILPALMSVLLATSSCTKTSDPQPVPKTDTVPNFAPQEFLDYTFFKAGSYWVYEEATTKKLDSIYVYKTWDTTYTKPSWIVNVKSNEHRMYFYSTYRQDSLEARIPGNFDVSENQRYNWCSFIYLKDDTTESTLQLSYPVYHSGISITTGDVITYAYKPFKLALPNYNFDSATYVQHSNMIVRYDNDNPLGRECKEYYAPRYGLVKYELRDSNQVWNLVRSSLVR